VLEPLYPILLIVRMLQRPSNRPLTPETGSEPAFAWEIGVGGTRRTAIRESRRESEIGIAHVHRPLRSDTAASSESQSSVSLCPGIEMLDDREKS
jgi:hypothetical protein